MSNALLTASMDTTDALPLRKSSHMLYEDRLKSFDTWPKQLTPYKHDLAKAGFVYTGKSDRVYCFNCRIILHDWEASNEPWSEHEMWSPDCSYLKIVGYTKASVGAVRPNFDEIDNGRNSKSATSSGFRFGGLGGFGTTSVGQNNLPAQTSTSTSTSTIPTGFRFGGFGGFGTTSVGQNNHPTPTSTATCAALTGGSNFATTTAATTTAQSIFQFGPMSSTPLPPNSTIPAGAFVGKAFAGKGGQSHLF